MNYYKILRESVKKVPGIMPDLLAMAGAAAISFGFYKIAEPAGFIALGVMLISGAIIFSKAQ